MIDRDTLLALPKVALHDHLDGGLRPATIIELAAEIGYELPTTDPALLEQWFYDAANSGDLPTYLTTFDHTTAVMQTRESLIRVTREAVEDLAADNVVFAELRYAPEQHLRNGLSLQEVVEATVQGVKEGERIAAEAGKTIHVRLILCAMRHADRATEIAQLTIDNYGVHSPGEGYVGGFDIAGAEFGFPPSNHAAAFALLREHLVPFTIHGGEADGVESLRSALAQGARRIGHGVRVYEDFDATMTGMEAGPVAAFMRDQGIVLEVCPTSNTQTGVCDSIEDHPFNLLYELGFTLTVNTDNRLVSGTTMTRELEVLVDAFDFQLWQLLEFTTNALKAAFCDEDLRTALLNDVIYPGFAAAMEDAGELDQDSAAGYTDGGATGAREALLGMHAHDQEHGFAMSMEALKEELASLGLELDDDDAADDADDEAADEDKE